MKNVIIYTRVSTDEQADRGFSLRHQKAVLEQYCIQKEYTILKHFEEDHSAKNFDRPEWKKLLTYVKANKRNIDALLFTKFDRFSRNTEDAYRTIREFKNWGIEVNAIEQQIDFSQPDSKLLLAINLVVPEVENDKISMRTRDGLRKAMEEGCFVGIAPHGYKNHRNEQGKATLAPNPETAPVIVKMFEEYATGLYGTEHIRKKYYSKLKISKNTLLNILKNPVYVGKIYIKEYQKHEAKIVDGLHPAIVDEDTFMKVQKLFESKKQEPVHTYKEIDQILPLRGVLICPSCGKIMTGSGSKGRNGKHHYYYHSNPPCKVRFKAHEVHDIFLAMLREMTVHEDFKAIYKKVLNRVTNEQDLDRELEEAKLKRDLKKLELRLESIHEKFFDEVIDLKTYNQMKYKTEQQIGDIKAQLESFKIMEKEFSALLSERISFLESIEKTYSKANTANKKRLLASLFPEPLIFEQEYFTTPKIDPFAAYILLGEKPLRYLKVG